MNASMPVRLCAAAFCLATVCSTQAAPPKKTAPAKPAASAASDAVSAESLASREQLRQCLDTEASLRARQKALNAEGSDVNAELADVQTEQKSIVEAQGKLDLKDKPGVDAFNKTLGEHNERITAVNAKSQAFNAKKDALNAELDTYNGGCGTMKYKADDRAAIMKEREAK